MTLSLSLVAGLLVLFAGPLPSVSLTAPLPLVTLEDFDDIVTPFDMGFNDFGGNMGVIAAEFGSTSLECSTPESCALRFRWNFGTAREVFTGIFMSLFGLTDTLATLDGETVETITFPEHSLNLDRIDGALNEPAGPRRFEALCTEVSYTGAQDLKLRLELKDNQQGTRFTRMALSGRNNPQTLCWDFRTSFSPNGTPFDLERAKELVLVVERENVADNVINPVAGTLDLHRIWFTADRSEPMPTTDEELLDLMERRAYQYFLDWSSRKPASQGLAQDRSTFGDLLTIGGTGFALPAHAIAAERGWISRAEAASRTLDILTVLDNPDAFGPERVGQIGHRGWFYHFTGIDGRRKLNFDFPETERNEALNTVELSSIDTGLVLMGVLAAQTYYDDPSDPIEDEIRQRAQAIYDRVDWSFMLEPASQQFYLGWKPNETYEGPAFQIPDADEQGHYSGIVGDPGTLDFYTDEALILILLASGAKTDPLPVGIYPALQLCQEGEQVTTWPGALFTYQFLHAFFDTRTWQPCSPTSWYVNSRRAIYRAIEYAKANQAGFATYGPDAWGLSAAEGPFDLYHAYGAPPLACSLTPEEDGTITYYGMLSAAGFGDDLLGYATDALRAGWRRGHWHPRFGLPDAFHADIGQIEDPPPELLRQRGPWVQRALFAIDQGPMLLHLENARTGMVWDLLARNPNIRRAQERLASSGTTERIDLEAEDGSGDGQTMMRSNASSEKTRWLHAGETLTITTTIADPALYTFSVRYSNDNLNTRPGEQVQVIVDDTPLDRFTAQDTGDSGYGWNVFVTTDPLGPIYLWPGEHTIQIEVTGGDTYGVEIDVIYAEYEVCTHYGIMATKTASSDSVRPGKKFEYALQLTNVGIVDLHTVVTDVLPLQVSPNDTLTWTPTITAPGGTWTEHLRVTPIKGYLGPLTNVLQVSSREGATANARNVVTAEIKLCLPLVHGDSH